MSDLNHDLNKSTLVARIMTSNTSSQNYLGGRKGDELVYLRPTQNKMEPFTGDCSTVVVEDDDWGRTVTTVFDFPIPLSM